MATHRRVSPKFWQDPKVRRWDDQEKLLAQYLMTCSHRTTEGLFWLPIAYIANDLGWSIEGVSEVFRTLVDDGFAAYDEPSETVLLMKALKYQPPAGPKQIQGALNSLADVPPTPLFSLLSDVAKVLAPEFGQALNEALTEGALKHLRYTFDSASEGYRPSTPSPTPSPTTRGESVSEPPTAAGASTTSGGRGYPDEFETLWDRYPRKVAKGAAHKAWRARLRAGASNEELLEAVDGYAEVCKKKNTELVHVMHGATFLGPDDRWQDYLPGGAALAEVRHLRAVTPEDDWNNTVGNLSRPLEDFL